MTLLDHTYTKTGQVVVVAVVKIRHDGGFATQQSTVGLHAAATDPVDDLLQQRRVIAAHGHVIEKEQRFGSAAQHVIDAHGHEVDTHGVVPPEALGDFQLGTHAVGTGNQNRLVVLTLEQRAFEIELEEARKASIVGHNAGLKVRCIKRGKRCIACS